MYKINEEGSVKKFVWIVQSSIPYSNFLNVF